jgi:hypothetical protein
MDSKNLMSSCDWYFSVALNALRACTHVRSAHARCFASEALQARCTGQWKHLCHQGAHRCSVMWAMPRSCSSSTAEPTETARDSAARSLGFFTLLT